MTTPTPRAPRVLDLPAGSAGLEVLRAALEPLATSGGGGTEAVAPVPSESARVSAEYRARLIAAIDPATPVPAQCDVILTTSGSTAAPKGVMHTWGAFAHAAHALHHRLDGPGSWLCALPLHTSAGFMTVARAVVAGTATVAVNSLGGAAAFTAEGFVQAAKSLPEGRAYTSLVPAMAQRLLGDDAALHALRRFDAVLLGGQAIPTALVETLRAAGVNPVLSYGMTETCGGCVYDGTALEGVNISIDSGRVRATGPVVMLGYRGSEPANGSFLTSDLGSVDAGGIITIDGRVDDIETINGVNVSMTAVEGLLRDLGINAVACAGSSAVLVVAATSVGPDEQSVATQRAREQFAVRLDFRVTRDVPTTTAGKVDRRQLARDLES